MGLPGSVLSDNQHTWEEQTEVIDGNLLVIGTITAQKLVVDELTVAGSDSGALHVPENGVDLINLAPNTAMIDETVSIVSSVTSGSATAATSLTAGERYVIDTPGSTDWTLIGAMNNDEGTQFIATGAGAGSGVAIPGYKDTLAEVSFDAVFDTQVVIQRSLDQEYPQGEGPSYGYQVRGTVYDPWSSGRIAGVQVVTNFTLGTTEYKVSKAYQDILKRYPDQAGFDYYVGELNGSMSEVQMRANLMASAEFIATKGISERRNLAQRSESVSGFTSVPVQGGSIFGLHMIAGREYVIASIVSPGDDFTTVGASRNEVGVRFTATGPLSVASSVNELVYPAEVVPSRKYLIYESGDTDFTAMGASYNRRGQIFRATAAGAGSGLLMNVNEVRIGLEWYGLNGVGGQTMSAKGSLSVRGSVR